MNAHVQPSTYASAIQQMVTSISNHRAINNKFYRLWMKTKLNPRQLEIFADNYYHRIEPTVSRIARAFVATDDVVSRAVFVRNLSDELGGGDPEGAHILILKRWLDSLLTKQANHPFENTGLETSILPTTRRLTEESLKLCSGPAPCANGAILAQEWHAYTQLVNLYEGFRNYMDSYTLEEFHDLSEYFYIHIGSAEKEHMQQSVITAARACKSDADLAMLKDGYGQFLDLVADFWDGLYDAVQAEAAPLHS